MHFFMPVCDAWNPSSHFETLREKPEDKARRLRTGWKAPGSILMWFEVLNQPYHYLTTCKLLLYEIRENLVLKVLSAQRVASGLTISTKSRTC